MRYLNPLAYIKNYIYNDNIKIRIINYGVVVGIKSRPKKREEELQLVLILYCKI